jgi:Skp family chaperone for outer membrane proteins
MSAAAVAAAALAITSDALAQRNRGQSTTAVVINYQRVLAESALGRDLQAKLGQVRQQIGQEAQSLAPEQQSLESERQRLAGVTRNMSAEQIRNNADFQRFQQRLQQLEGRAQSLQGDMQCTQLITLRDFDRQVTPIVRSVMESRGAGVVLDAANVQLVLPEFDITTTVIQQLDQNQATRTANVTRHAVAECQAQQPAQAPAQ